MSTRNMQGVVSPIIPASIAGGSNYSGVYTLDQLNRLNAVYPNHIGNSLRFRSSANAYLNRTPASAGNQTTWTWSAWVKRGALGAAQSSLFFSDSTATNYAGLLFAGDVLEFVNRPSAGVNARLITTQVFRDPSAWYHIVVVWDSANATSGDRVRLYVNGTRVTAFSTATYPSINTASVLNTAIAHEHGSYVAANSGTPAAFFDGYLAEVNFIDGQALTPSAFGKFYYETGVWCPSKYTGTYGTNGFYLPFTNTTSTTTLGYDASGNSNNWTPNNISLTAGSTYDSMLDSPTNYDNGGNGVGNYAVLNPVNNLYVGATISGGNLDISYPGGSNSAAAASSIAIRSGTKVYFEIVSTTSTYPLTCGVRKVGTNPVSSEYLGYTANEYSILQGNGNKYNNNSGSAYGVTFTANDILGCAVDLVNGTIYWSKNGTWMNSGDPVAGTGFAFSGLSGDYYACIGTVAGGNTCSGSINFGQRPFSYTPPTGFKALNTQNLPAPSIQNGANFMAATLYTGNGATQSIVNAVNGVSFQPDFVWGKLRTTSSYHRLSDSVRGASLTLATNVTDAEVSGNGLVSFDAAGFSMNSSTNINQVYPYVAWQWKAGGTAVTNTAGSITSSVSANTTSGFAVVTYTGTGSNATVGHGLGVAPSMIINKSRNAAQNWTVFHAGLANMTTAYVRLNTTDAAGTLGNAVATPTSTTFGISASTADTSTYVAYCFAAIPGFSAFGSYTGNGSSSGPFIYTGFLPRFILIKSTSASRDWIIWDTARNPYNIGTAGVLFPDTSGAEYSGGGAYAVSVVSNGFYLPVSTANLNGSGETMIYAAFAENPFNYSLAR